MQVNTQDNVPINDILADVLVMVDDAEIKKGLTRGWYIRQIQNAMEQLAIDTHYQVFTADLDFPENYILPEPKNCFNPREIYLYNGECGKPTTSRPVVFKKRFNNSQGGTDYTARRKETMEPDPFLISGGEKNLYYANIQDGMIMFGASCSGYKFVRLVFNGLGTDIGVEPIIPRVFREAVKDYVRVQALTVFSARDKGMLPILQMALMDKDGQRNNPGSWAKAKKTAARANTWIRQNLDEYQGRMNY